MRVLKEKIIKKGNKWQVTSEDGKKNLGTYDTEEEAKKRLQQVHFFKNKGKKVNEKFVLDDFTEFLKKKGISDPRELTAKEYADYVKEFRGELENSENKEEIKKLRYRLLQLNKAVELGEDPEYVDWEKKKIMDRLDTLGVNYYDESLSLKEKVSPEGYAPTKTGKAYKVFKVRNGKLYPPMVANAGGEDTPIGVWLDAEEGEFIELDGMKRVIQRGANGERLRQAIANLDNLSPDERKAETKKIKSSTLAYRPGWHLGDEPRASQFDREASWEYVDQLPNGESVSGNVSNEMTLAKKATPSNIGKYFFVKDSGKYAHIFGGNGQVFFPYDFVWAECDYVAEIDYQEEAMSYGYRNGKKFQHSLAGLPRVPEGGSYKYRTNPKPETVPWVITGAMKVNRLLSDAEVNSILKGFGVSPVPRQGGDKTLAELGLRESFMRKNRKTLRESVDLDTLIKKNLKPMELCKKIGEIVRYGTEEWKKFIKYVNTYFEKHPVDLDDTIDFEFLDDYEDGENIEVFNDKFKTYWPHDFNKADGVLEDDYNDEIIISKTNKSGVVYIVSNVLGDGFTTMKDLKTYFNDESTFNYNLQEMVKDESEFVESLTLADLSKLEPFKTVKAGNGTFWNFYKKDGKIYDSNGLEVSEDEIKKLKLRESLRDIRELSESSLRELPIGFSIVATASDVFGSENVYTFKKIKDNEFKCIDDGTSYSLLELLYALTDGTYSWFETVNESLKEGAEGKREPGYEYVIYWVDYEAKTAYIVNKRSTRTEAAYLCSQLSKKSDYDITYEYEKVPKGKFHKGDDFWGPFDQDYNKLESLKEAVPSYYNGTRYVCVNGNMTVDEFSTVSEAKKFAESNDEVTAIWADWGTGKGYTIWQRKFGYGESLQLKEAPILKEAKQIWGNTQTTDYWYDADIEEIKSALEDNAVDYEGWSEDEMRDYFTQDDYNGEADYEDFEYFILPAIDKQCYDDVLVLFGDYARWNGSRGVVKVLPKVEKLEDYFYPNYDATIKLFQDETGLYYTESNHDTPMGGTKIYLYSLKNIDDVDKLDKWCAENGDFDPEYDYSVDILKDHLGYTDIKDIIDKGILTPVKDI